MDDWPDLGCGVARWPDDEFPSTLDQPPREVVGHRLVDDDALGRHADLALVHEGAEARRRRGLLQISVSEHKERGLAAELENHTGEMAAGQLADDAAHAARSREI